MAPTVPSPATRRPPSPPRFRRHLLAGAACAVLQATASATPADPPSDPPSTAPVPDGSSPYGLKAEAPVQRTFSRMRVGFERVKLPGGERMGLAGLTELVNPVGDWWVGAGVYGAVTGQRGGLLVPGVELAWAPSLGEHTRLDAGLFVGGGGGHAAPVGGGLMLRPHLDLLWGGNGFATGPTVSWVSFADHGSIRSAQLGWVLNIASDFTFRFADDGAATRDGSGHGASATGLGFDRIDATVTRYTPRAGSASLDTGAPLGPIELVGLRATHAVGPNLWTGVEVNGAAKGGVAGYAEVLGTGGLRWPVAGGRVEFGVRGALGMGGGGGVDTGGGFLWKAAGGATWHVTDTMGVAAEVGLVGSPQGHFRARTMDVALDWQLDPAPWGRHDGTRMEWVAGVERYEAGRKDGTTRPLAAGVLALDRFVSPHFYLTGQAHSAIAGGAGAYSVGLFGVGTQWPVASHVRVGAELLGGAAGGGGVDTQGGALLQGRGYVDVALNRVMSLRVGAGKVKSVHGTVDATSVDAALVFRFGVDRPR